MQGILERADVPVIFLSAYGQDDVVARAFDLGADDYVVKPFSPTELAARIRAALRKRELPEPVEPSEPYVLGGLVIDYAGREVRVAGSTLELTPNEYDVLFELSVYAGRVVPHGHLLRRVWGPQNSGDTGLVRTIVRRLRRKLGDDADNPGYIFAEPSIGYRMERSEAQEPEEA
jgi:two-component system KDP operon response regulator KdpE